MTPADVIALIEAITSAIAASRQITPQEIAVIERVVWGWFHSLDEPARLADPIDPILAEARASLIADISQRSAGPDAPTDRPPPPDEDPPTLRKGSGLCKAPCPRRLRRTT